MDGMNALPDSSFTSHELDLLNGINKGNYFTHRGEVCRIRDVQPLVVDFYSDQHPITQIKWLKEFDDGNKT
jgi:hypothetical protein